MAEAILRREAGASFEACSAGISPTSVSLLAVQVMSEAGYNLTNQRTKRIHEFTGMTEVRYVIDLCNSTRQGCPSTWPELKKRLHWTIDDPEQVEVDTLNQKVQLFRRCRDTLMARIKSWLKEPGVLDAVEGSTGEE